MSVSLFRFGLSPFLYYLIAATPGEGRTVAASQRLACFSPPSTNPTSGRRITNIESVGLSATNGDRRSVLREGAFGVSALVSARAQPTVTEAKVPPKTSSNDDRRRTLNFPRVRPGLWIGDPSSGEVCEIFVDLACPYSRTMFATLSKVSGAYTDRMAFVFHNVVQPWHHQSLWLHESTFAVKILYPAAELAYWTALFDEAPRWYDKEVYGATRGEFYEDIARFAAGVVVVVTAGGIDPGEGAERILQYLIPPKQPGGHFPDGAGRRLGSGPEEDENALFPLTQQVVKFARKRGVHVTPTVFFNGIEQAQISSIWKEKEWRDFLNRALS